FPRYCSSFDSNLANSANESAAEPANPARILLLYRRRIFVAPCLTIVSPSVTWPSPAMTALSRCRIARIVVEWNIRRVDPVRGEGQGVSGKDHAYTLINYPLPLVPYPCSTYIDAAVGCQETA